MKGRGRKTTFRLWPEAVAALRSLKEQFPPIDRYCKSEELISSAIKILPKVSKRRAVEPLTREEVSSFLCLAKTKVPRLYPLFLCAARTGLRQGELLALQWDDIHYIGRFIEVRRSITHGALTTPKSGESRRVDMSLELTQALKDLRV